MAKEEEDRSIVLSDVLLRYADLDEPYTSTQGGKPKFGVTVINDDSSSKYDQNKAKIEDACGKAEIAGGIKLGLVQKVKDPKRRFFEEGSDYVDDDDNIIEGFDGAGAMVIKAKTKDQPTLWDREKEDVDQDQINKVFTPGVRVDVKIWPYTITDDDRGGRGGFWTLDVVRYRKKDRVFASGKPAANKDEFDDVDDVEDDDML